MADMLLVNGRWQIGSFVVDAAPTEFQLWYGTTKPLSITSAGALAITGAIDIEGSPSIVRSVMYPQGYTNTYDFGTAGARWKDGYFAGTLSFNHETRGDTATVPLNRAVSIDLISGGKVNIGSSNLTGMVTCGNSTGAVALYAILGPLSTTAEVSDPKAQYSPVGGTTNSINVYWDSTAAQYAIENRTGSTASISAFFMGR